MYRLTLIFSFISVFTLNTEAQLLDSSGFNLPGLRITELKNKQEVIFIFDESKNFFILYDSILTADPNKYDYKVNINNIKKIAVYKGTSFFHGLGYGAGLGFVLGFVFGAFIIGDVGGGKANGGIDGGMMVGALAVLPSALIGGIIGFFMPRYNEYNILQYPAGYKKTKLHGIFYENSIK